MDRPADKPALELPVGLPKPPVVLVADNEDPFRDRR
jgi:hypothetical protein